MNSSNHRPIARYLYPIALGIMLFPWIVSWSLKFSGPAGPFESLGRFLYIPVILLNPFFVVPCSFLIERVLVRRGILLKEDLRARVLFRPLFALTWLISLLIVAAGVYFFATLWLESRPNRQEAQTQFERTFGGIPGVKLIGYDHDPIGWLDHWYMLGFDYNAGTDTRFIVERSRLVKTTKPQMAGVWKKEKASPEWWPAMLINTCDEFYEAHHVGMCIDRDIRRVYYFHSTGP